MQALCLKGAEKSLMFFYFLFTFFLDEKSNKKSRLPKKIKILNGWLK
jgi:hypothetical protein